MACGGVPRKVIGSRTVRQDWRRFTSVEERVAHVGEPARRRRTQENEAAFLEEASKLIDKKTSYIREGGMGLLAGHCTMLLVESCVHCRNARHRLTGEAACQHVSNAMFRPMATRLGHPLIWTQANGSDRTGRKPMVVCGRNFLQSFHAWGHSPRDVLLASHRYNPLACIRAQVAGGAAELEEDLLLTTKELLYQVSGRLVYNDSLQRYLLSRPRMRIAATSQNISSADGVGVVLLRRSVLELRFPEPWGHAPGSLVQGSWVPPHSVVLSLVASCDLALALAVVVVNLVGDLQLMHYEGGALGFWLCHHAASLCVLLGRLEPVFGPKLDLHVLYPRPEDPEEDTPDDVAEGLEGRVAAACLDIALTDVRDLEAMVMTRCQPAEADPRIGVVLAAAAKACCAQVVQQLHRAHGTPDSWRKLFIVTEDSRRWSLTLEGVRGLLGALLESMQEGEAGADDLRDSLAELNEADGRPINREEDAKARAALLRAAAKVADNTKTRHLFASPAWKNILAAFPQHLQGASKDSFGRAQAPLGGRKSQAYSYNPGTCAVHAVTGPPPSTDPPASKKARRTTKTPAPKTPNPACKEKQSPAPETNDPACKEKQSPAPAKQPAKQDPATPMEVEIEDVVRAVHATAVPALATIL